MKDPRIELRSPAVAAVLAFLLPGAGHLYQGRRLKAGVYAVCILGLFFSGMILGDWQPVYSQVVQPSGAMTAQMQETLPRTNYSIGYAAQVLIGLPALPALVQQERFRHGDGPTRSLLTPIDSDFQGALISMEPGRGEVTIPVSGRLRLEPGASGIVSGRFEGTSRDGDPIEIDVQGGIELARPIYGSPRRIVRCVIYAGEDQRQQQELRGTIERPFPNWFQAPRDNHELDRLHGKLSQKFDLALMFTWVAGLLNLMAVWDAFDGPAYGYGDEDPPGPDDEKPKNDD